jgi:hypothetical protein
MKLGWIAVGAAWLTCAACLSPPVAHVDAKVKQQTSIRVPQDEKNRVDILFLVDNSPSMEAMQAELQDKFGHFFDVFVAAAQMHNYADLNIGVITSDYGAGKQNNTGKDPMTGIPFGCKPAPGDAGLLQRTAASFQKLTGCAGPVGTPFIHYTFGPDGDTSNLPSGATLSETFTCIASVGANGCGFEHQLESVYAALTNKKENAGFLRPGALLAIVFLTNEDDGSASPNTSIYDDPGDPQLHLGFYDTYRQTRFGVACGTPLALAPYAPADLLSSCVPAENDDKVQIGQEYDVSRYTKLLLSDRTHGGLKDDPLDNVILVSIDAPLTPFSIIAANRATGAGILPSPAYEPCKAGDQVGTSACVYRLQHSCQNRAKPGFFGDPPVRLESVIQAAKLKHTVNICGDDLDVAPDYSAALADVAKLITSALPPGCIPARLTDANHPECVVEDVALDDNGAVTFEQQLMSCRLDQSGMPTPDSPFPCWAVQHKASCSSAPEGLGVAVFRHGIAPPPGTSLRVECSTIADPPK